MNKTFSDMKSNVGLELQDATTPFATLIGKWLNRRYFQVLRTINFNAINPSYTLSTASGVQEYALPRDFSKAVYVIDSTNNNTFKEVRFDEYASSPYFIDESGYVNSYTVYDSPVQVQPTAASVVTVVSSSTVDTSATVSIRGTVGGVETIETLTLNGTTNVTGTKSFTRVIAVTKSATVGFVTVTCNSQQIALMDAELKVNKCKIIKFFSVPSSVATISIPYHILPLPMSDNNDVPLIDIDDCLEAGARSDGWRYKRQGAKAAAEEQIFSMMLADYQWQQENNPNLANQFKPVPYPRD